VLPLLRHWLLVVRQIEEMLTPRYLRTSRKVLQRPVGRLDVTPA
jgi:hypothetical protein